MLLDRAYPETFTHQEALFLSGLQGPPQTVRSRTRIVRAHTMLDRSLYLEEGMVGRYTCDRSGRRQFVGLQIPGDYFDLAAYLLGTLDHDVDALGEATLRETAFEDLNRVRDEHPELYSKLWRISLIDASVHRYWIFRTGRLAGKARLANFLAEMYTRLYARGLCGPEGYRLPLSQNDLAEVCGMTSVHVNRLLRELRLDRICTILDGMVQVENPVALIRLGQFSPAFLYLESTIAERVALLLNGTAEG